MNKHIVQAVIGAALLGTAALASADTAEAAFKRGKAAQKAGKIHEACGEFETSDKLEPKVETELNLAACYADDGKLVSASNLYRAVADKDPNADRKKTSAEKAAKLLAKASKLRLVLSARPEGLAITVDGVAVAATGDVPVDAGPHEVVVTAPGFQGHASPAVDGSRPIVDVIVRMEPKAEPAPPVAPVAPAPMVTPTTPPTTADASMTASSPPVQMEPQGHRKRNGAIIGGVGVGLLVTSGAFLVAASGKHDDEQNLCPNAVCHTGQQVAVYNLYRRDARNDRGVAYGVGIPGLVFVGVGAYLLLSHHHEAAEHIALDVRPGSGTLGYIGHF